MQIFILNICLSSFRKEDIFFNSIENMKMKTSIGLFYKSDGRGNPDLES
jgi:hypothetical protein